ncbi:hypothetical protein [Streptomyces sp. NPDC057460]|uniref:hypothetical protein n=1 Tax=Streptomyces sp. NPDC057460 TaxID=3346141 RepID=UPI0036C15018
MTDAIPAGWRVLAVPSNWQPTDSELHIREVTFDYVTTPDSFLMTIQTPDMIDADEPTMIVVTFRASTYEGITLVKIAGMGKWERYLGDVVQGFPPTEWVQQAQGLIVDFLRLPHTRAAAAEPLSNLPRRHAELGDRAYSVDVHKQRRRRITPEHLHEVATVYATAQKNDEPPTRAVQAHFAVSHSTAAKWVGAARRAGQLPPHESDE